MFRKIAWGLLWGGLVGWGIFGCGTEEQDIIAIEADFSKFFENFETYDLLMQQKQKQIVLAGKVIKNIDNRYKNLADILLAMHSVGSFSEEDAFAFQIIQQNHYHIAVLLQNNNVYFLVKYKGIPWEFRGLQSNGWIYESRWRQSL